MKGNGFPKRTSFRGLTEGELNTILRIARGKDEGFYLILRLIDREGISYGTASKLRFRSIGDKKNPRKVLLGRNKTPKSFLVPSDWLKKFKAYERFRTPRQRRTNELIFGREGNLISKKRANEMFVECCREANIEAKGRVLNLNILRINWIIKEVNAGGTVKDILKRIGPDYFDIITHYAKIKANRMARYS